MFLKILVKINRPSPIHLRCQKKFTSVKLLLFLALQLFSIKKKKKGHIALNAVFQVSLYLQLDALQQPLILRLPQLFNSEQLQSLYFSIKTLLRGILKTKYRTNFFNNLFYSLCTTSTTSQKLASKHGPGEALLSLISGKVVQLTQSKSFKREPYDPPDPINLGRKLKVLTLISFLTEFIFCINENLWLMLYDPIQKFE